MSQISPQNLDKLMDDIKTIKTTLNKNRPLLYHIFLPAPLRIVGIVGGLSVIIFCMAFYFLTMKYGSHAGIPVGIKYTIYCLLFADWIFIGIIKNRNIIRSMKTVDPGYSLFDVFKYMHAGGLWHMYLPVALIMFALSTLLVHNGQLEYIVPVLAIGMGLMYNFMGVNLRLREYVYSGYWIMLTGLLAAVFPQVSPLIDSSISFGIGLLLFGLLRLSPTEPAGE